MSDNPRVVKPGFYNTMSPEIYHGDSYPGPALSCGVIKDLLFKSPRHAWLGHPALNMNMRDEEDSESKFDVGTAAHALLLEGDEKIHVVNCDDWKKPANRDERDEARRSNLLPLNNREYARVKRMAEVATQSIAGCADLGITNLRTDGKSERSVIWREGQDGEFWCKCRPDWLSNDKKLMLDYKTTGRLAKPTLMNRHILEMGYDIQNAWYVHGVFALSQISPRFVLLFQEDKEPHLCSFVELEPEFYDFGQMRIAKGFALWQECLTTGNWPGYPAKVMRAPLPGWASTNWELEEAYEEDER